MSKHEKIEPAPHFINVEAEQQLLGALLLDASRIDMMGDMGTSDLFGEPAHARIFDAIRRRYRNDEPVSPVALRMWGDGEESLKPFGGPQYLVRLAAASISGSAVGDYTAILADTKAKRDISEALTKAQESLRSDEDSTADIVGRVEASLAASPARSATGPVSMVKATTEAVQRAVAAYNGEETPGVQTGIWSLDRIMNKMSPGQLILLGGRPSMGKSAVALSIGMNVARSGGGVVFASLEMPPEAMAQRAISETTSQLGNAVPYANMDRALPEFQMRTVSEAARIVSELPIQFLPAEYRDLGALYAGAKRSKALLGETCGLKLLIVDYLQLLRADGRSRYEQMTEISIALKSLAMRLNVPVLALSQLSRALEQREDKRPQMSDLRETGQLEQDADAVLFCYRDEYYIQRDEPSPDDLEAYELWRRAMDKAQGHLEIILGKQRMGDIGTARVRFAPATNFIWEG
ncbi:replicative DNA helicase [Tranquillimonas rosea]|uniref:replicative DNA helicase n=1 Tax=Tranquillimonas rosea TaxID=641238 RepID=UPI003BA8B468